MNPAYLPAIAALAASAIGRLTSLASTWLSQSRQDEVGDAIMPQPQMKVVVFQRPCGTLSTRRSACGAPAIKAGHLVMAAVSSTKTNRFLIKGWLFFP